MNTIEISNKIFYVIAYNGKGGAFVQGAHSLGSDQRDDVDDALQFDSAEAADKWADINIQHADDCMIERIYCCGRDAYCEVEPSRYATKLLWDDCIIHGVRVN